MRKYILTAAAAFAAAAFLSSCSKDHKIRLDNGAVIIAGDPAARDFQKGARKLHFGGQGWKIDDNGTMKDTVVLTAGGNALEFVTGSVIN